MAGISSDYYSISSYANSRTAFTGLASGLDTDSIIETMMKGYQSRLNTLYQKRDKTEWKIDAYRDVSNSLLDFQKKYLSSTSSSSIFSSGFFQSATITSKGTNASAVTVSGGVNDVKNLQIKEVTQLAKTSTLTSGAYGSQHAIYSDFNIADAMSNGRYYSSLEDQTLNLSVNGATYNLKLSDIAVSSGSKGSDYAGDAANIVKAMNESLQDAGIGDKVKAQLNNGRVSLVATDRSAGTVKISGGGKTLLNTLGLSTGQTTSYGSTGITGTKAINNTKTYEVSNLSSLKGKSITFDLDGVSKKITFDDNYKNSSNKAMNFSDIKDEKDFVAYLNGKLKDSFGVVKDSEGKDVNRVKVSLSDASDSVGAGKLKFETTDPTAILSVATGETGAVGASSFLGLKVGDANRLLRFEKIANSNLDLSQEARDSLKNGGSQDVTINGTTFSVYSDKIVVTGTDGKKTTHDFKEGTTIANLQDVINDSNIGATIKYNSTSDKFTLTATESGSLGELNISYSNDASKNALTNALFGTKDTASVVSGQDAKVIVSLDGGNTWETVSRSSNSFTLDGMNITLNETFSAEEEKDEAGNVTGVKEADIVTFSGKANTDEMIEKIKEFVEEYNNIARAVNSQLSARADSNYQPLTSDQKKELSEDQIKLYEEKAKVGLLAGDSTLRSLSTDLRFAMSMPTGGDMLSSIGISTVSYLTDPTGSKYGLLEIDEEKLRQALETNPDRVEKLFVGGGAGSSDDGVLNRLNSVMNKYAATSSIPEKRGLLIQKAGNKANALTLTDNSMYRELSSINSQIDSFIDKMKAKQESYYKQFATLETFINQMNQQSSWLSSSLGMSY